MSDRSTWYRIRREMFDQLLAEVQARLGRESGELGRYRADYDRDIHRRWKLSHREELLKQAMGHRVILLGDFHALQQSQKTHLRLLQALQEAEAGPFVLGLECLQSKDQKQVDAFLEGRLSEKEFLKRVRWKETWGFPWEHYRPLFQWARRTRTPLWALNSREDRLAARDRGAAKRLKEARTRWPERRLIVIFGDLHLGQKRLPQQLKSLLKEPVLRVFQNAEGPFFQLMKKGLDHQVDVIRYDRDSFAVLSVPPWVKWHNYLLWLEQWADGELDGESADGTDAVAGLVRWLKEELNVSASESGLTVYTAGDPDVWSRIARSTSPRERAWIETMIEDGRSFYLSKAGWGYLARPSVNHAASLAMQYLHDSLCGGATLAFRMPQDFQRMIWIEAVAYFGSKVINPKRKSDTLTDIRASLSSREADDRGREALRLALSQKMTEMMAAAGGRDGVTLFRPRRKSSWIAAAHLLGALAGERLYAGYRRRRLPVMVLQSLLRKPLGHEQFPVIYDELQEIIESMPAPFRSKKEKL